MSDIDINRVLQNIKELQDQNAIDFQQWKRLGQEIERLDGKIKTSDNHLNLLMKKIKSDYESLRKVIIDENVQFSLINKIEENKKEIDNSNDKINDLEIKKASKTELEIERKRIDNLTTLDGSVTTGDAELIDGRVGADGVTYDNIGDAIRTQVTNIQKEIKYEKEVDYSSKIVKGKFVDKNGTEVPLEEYNYVKKINVHGFYSVTLKNVGTSGNACVVSYNKDGDVIGKINTSNWTPSTETIVLGEDVYYISVSYSKNYPLTITGRGLKYLLNEITDKLNTDKNTTIVWVDDDTDKIGIEYVYNACVIKGVNATLACISNKLATDSELKARLLELEEQGLEIALHGYSHDNTIWNNDNSNSKSIISNITRGYRELKDFQNYKHLVTPNGANSEMIKSVAKRFSPCLVSAWEGVNKKEWGDKARYDLGRYWMTNHTLEEFKKVIDGLRPKNDLLILATHSAPSVAPWDKQKIEAMIQYVLDSGYNIVTLSEGIKYFYDL